MKQFIKYTNSTLQGYDITPILFLHDLDTFTSTSDMVQGVMEGHSQADCLLKCWERGNCFTVQVIYEAFDSNNVKWCMLLAVGENSTRVIDRPYAVREPNNTFRKIYDKNLGHPYLAANSIMAAANIKPMAVFVKRKSFAHLVMSIKFVLRFAFCVLRYFRPGLMTAGRTNFGIL